MKKFAKMSLVAALAIAGTAASAQPLAEAIKNVDVSGTAVYRYDDRSFKDEAKAAGRDSSDNNYKIGLSVKAKVNDDITAVTRFIAGSQENGGFETLDYVGSNDGQADISLNNVYFSYTGLANTTINVGKQGLTTPWTVAIDADGNEQTGTGILALTNLGAVTLAGAYFNHTNLLDSGNQKVGTAGDYLATVGALGNFGPVALDLWYAELQDTLDSYTFGALANLDFDSVNVKLGARHTMVDLEGDDKDNSLTKVEAGLKAGIFGANIGYGWTDKEGGIAAFDNGAKTGYEGWLLNLNGVTDANLLKTNVNVQVLPSLNLALNYNVLTQDMGEDDKKAEELYLQATYKMSKNFGGYVRFGQAEFEKDYVEKGKLADNDGTIGRIQVQYSF